MCILSWFDWIYLIWRFMFFIKLSSPHHIVCTVNIYNIVMIDFNCQVEKCRITWEIAFWVIISGIILIMSTRMRRLALKWVARFPRQHVMNCRREEREPSTTSMCASVVLPYDCGWMEQLCHTLAAMASPPRQTVPWNSDPNKMNRPFLP